MPEKIIINNQTSLSTPEILRRVAHIADDGKKSGSGSESQYCYVSVFEDNVAIRCIKNKGESFTFNSYTLNTKEDLES